MRTDPSHGMHGDMRWLLFSGSGRIGRRTYILGIAFWAAVLAIPTTLAIRVEQDSAAMSLVGFGIILALLPAAWSVAMLSVKRLHDIGLPSALVLLLVIPGVEFIVFLGLMAWPPARGPNKYGPSPDRPGY